MKKQLLAAGIATTIGIAGLGAGVAHAQSTNTNKTDPMSNLVSAIATKFNLNKDDVQKVFDDQHSQMEAQHNQEVTDQVAQLVKDGKLTQAQADAINAKRTELQKQREANKDTFKNQTEAERKAAMDKQKTELETWAKQNGIDTQYLRYVMGGPGHGRGGPMGDPRGPDDITSSTNTQ